METKLLTIYCRYKSVVYITKLFRSIQIVFFFLPSFESVTSLSFTKKVTDTKNEINIKCIFCSFVSKIEMVAFIFMPTVYIIWKIL